ncbi:copper homeostasis periplasmic binding protein CopC [Tatumella citrea]|uniref:Copper resistance protein C n=1 Tax=Tatumella citrea TaxID=53336 RepID=A0A1Y0LBJ4_TATCI|nr:copper homeostasis periplasmic binding protein CopC [Tatumella citrea]ARU95403.1 hypothetical protein A7K98_17635 [Tatumella citrea]ARU99444.1 hypothetical protein A7K99_17620 [Tatumella citrea]
MSFSAKQTVIALSLLGSALLSQQALAHAHLTSAEPAQQSEVSVAPDHLTLHFSEDLEVAFTGITLSHDGTQVATGKASVEDTSKSTLIVPVTHPLSQGKYQVDWHALSVDGHKTKGSYTFSVK